MPHRILVADRLAPEGMAVLERAAGVEVAVKTGLKGDELRAALAEADGVIVRSGTRLTADDLEGQSRLRGIVRAGVGVDNIDLAAATRQGIVVMNTPAGNTVSTAEHTITMLLALSRNIAPAHESLRRGEWARSSFTGTQVAGKTLGVVGLGRIGQAVAKRALGLEMKVVGYDPFLSADRAAELGIESVSSLDEMLPRCDFLTIHTPLTDETQGLIGAERLALLPAGARVINCARGGIVDERALLGALESGHVAGAALDVFEQEPPPRESPLVRHPNVLVTPHLGASTAEAQTSVAVEAAQLMVDFLTDGEVRFAVNMVAISPKDLADVRGYLDLAWRLGLLQAQLVKGSIRTAKLLFRGEAMQRNTRLLTAAFTAGLLENALEEHVNLVNAELLARERGIKIDAQTSTAAGDFASLIVTEVQTEEQSLACAGTIFGEKFLRLVRLGEFHLDAYLDGVMFIMRHRDRPGLVGFMGTIFGLNQVNIAQMNVGRQQEKPGGDAIAVLNLDSEPPPEALKEVRSHPDVHNVSVVKLPKAGEPLPWLFR